MKTYMHLLTDCSNKNFVAWHKCTGNPFLCFQGSTHQFSIDDSYMQLNNSKETHCCIPMAKMVMWPCHYVMLYAHCLSC